MTLPIIEGHWRYGYHVTPVKTHANHDPWQNVTYNLESHWFTHIDFPLHFDPEGETSDDYPIEDWAYSDCLVLDLSYVGDNTAITGEIRGSLPEFFRRPVHVSAAVRTNQNYNPKVVGYDFPQDYEIRNIPKKKKGDPIPQPVHEHVLKQGKILQIEYMNNLWKIGTDVCRLVALPLNTQHADGMQIRVIAVVEE